MALDDEPVEVKWVRGLRRQNAMALEKNFENKVANAWRTETYIVLDAVRDQVCAFAGFTPRIDAFADKGNSRFHYFSDRNDDAFTKIGVSTSFG